MVNKSKYALVCCLLVTSVMSFANAARAEDEVNPEDMHGQIAVVYSPHKTNLSAQGYLVGSGQLPKDHQNEGDNYWGIMGEVNYGKVSFSLDYLRGKSDRINGGDDFSKPYRFNPLTYENSDTLDLSAGYNIVDNSYIGKIDGTLGYFRMWASPTISPPNWYEGPEIGFKGRRSWDGGNAFIYKVGYVPSVEVHGYMKDSNLMRGKDIWNVKVGGEFHIFGNISAVAGYMWTRAENVVVVNDENAIALNQYGGAAVVKFSGCYLGAMYSF
ncbi:MAG: hypothetical protein PHN84_02795 [Desulfuromonadaceae bacterium]|nr:hypothetical protein [Desulfuromonadaceae bacterium]MDD2855854.1 hypothetical protein [Desulfuromonadaceae bacterium]